MSGLHVHGSKEEKDFRKRGLVDFYWGRNVQGNRKGRVSEKEVLWTFIGAVMNKEI